MPLCRCTVINTCYKSPYLVYLKGSTVPQFIFGLFRLVLKPIVGPLCHCFRESKNCSHKANHVIAPLLPSSHHFMQLKLFLFFGGAGGLGQLNVNLINTKVGVDEGMVSFCCFYFQLLPC